MSKWAIIGVTACSAQMLFVAAQVDTAVFCVLAIELLIAAGMGFHIWNIYRKAENDGSNEHIDHDPVPGITGNDDTDHQRDNHDVSIQGEKEE